MPSRWFESVAVARQRAKRRLPPSVFAALVAGSERGQSSRENTDAFSELRVVPHLAGHAAQRSMATQVMGQTISLPVILSPTGVQAVHPEAEVAVARASASRNTLMGLSSFASKPIESVVAANPKTLFQTYWMGSRDEMIATLERARAAGAVGLILTLDWSFATARDWGSPWIPERLSVRAAARFAPEALSRPAWLAAFLRSGQIPNLTVPNLQRQREPAPTFFGAYGQWMQTPPPSWDDVAWLRDQWGGPLMIKGVARPDDARRAVDVGATAISVSNHGGNNLDGTPASIRLLKHVADACGGQVEVLLDGGVRRGSDAVKALCLGARAVMIGRPYLWGLAANGQEGVENVIDVFRQGIDSCLLALNCGSIDDLRPEHLLVPEGFHVNGDSAA